MNDKERLEEIKKKCSEVTVLGYIDDIEIVGVDMKDLVWLIQQAGKKEYWMKQHRKRANELEDAYFKIQLIENQLHQAQVKAERYKQALEFYADEEHYKDKQISEVLCDADGVYISNDEYLPSIIYLDKGETARKALESDEN